MAEVAPDGGSISLEGPVQYSVAGGVATALIDRPEQRNALSPAVVAGLTEAIRRAADDESIRVFVLSGSGDKAFCAGGDLGGMAGDAGRVGAHWQRAGIGELFATMRASRLPIIARVNGHALAGGFGLMLACDLVVAVDHAEIGMPEVNLGLWPFMISAIVQRDLPRKVALDLMLTGRRAPVEEGLRWGFVNRVVAAGDLDAAVGELGAQIASKSPLIVGLGKKSYYRAEDMATEPALAYLAGMLTLCLESEDTIEGVSAFLQKRDPEWKGR